MNWKWWFFTAYTLGVGSMMLFASSAAWVVLGVILIGLAAAAVVGRRFVDERSLSSPPQD